MSDFDFDFDGSFSDALDELDKLDDTSELDKYEKELKKIDIKVDDSLELDEEFSEEAYWDDLLDED